MQFEMNPCSDPTVSVVMPVYNAGEFLQEAVQSVLDQTFRCFEVIVIDDGSIDNSNEILKSFQKLDTRIAMYHQENSGVIASLNRGCKLAKGKYIARMDADDVCHPVRLEKQISFLEKHPEVGILGSAAFIVNEFGATVDQIVVPANPALIQWHLAFENCFVHSSVVMRRDVLQALDYYRSGARHAEDYDLWSRATDITRLTNLPDSLMKRRGMGRQRRQRKFHRTRAYGMQCESLGDGKRAWQQSAPGNDSLCTAGLFFRTTSSISGGGAQGRGSHSRSAFGLPGQT